jgi:drug/metabolite transporter (DMT)-like permease
MEKLAYLFIVIGAALWGTIGIFVQGLYEYGFTPLQVVTIRVTFAAFILLVIVLIKNPTAFFKYKINEMNKKRCQALL